jgi:hypothetical protein
VSEDGTNAAAFKVWAEPSDASWRFAMSTSDVANPTWDTASSPANTVQFGVWTQIVVTYKQSGGVMSLYVNGVQTGTAKHATTWNAAGSFHLGEQKTGASTFGTYLHGQASTTQVWSQVVPPAPPATPPAYYVPITQSRLLDTRTSPGTPAAAGSTTSVTIAGATIVGGQLPVTGVAAVHAVVNAVSPTGNGNLSVYPSGTAQPLTSNVNFTTNTTISNSVIIPVGADGKINIWTSVTTGLIVDVLGYFTTNAATTGISTFVPMTKTRDLDTRSGLGHPTGKIASGTSFTLTLTGLPSDVTAVAITLTATNQTGAGWLEAYAGGTRPNASQLQYTTGLSISQLDVVPVTNGTITIFNTGASTDIIGDVGGYFRAGSSFQKYRPIGAARLIDTRNTGTPVAAGGTLSIPQGNTVIAATPTIILNVTITQPTGPGFAVAYPDPNAPSTASDINWATNETVPDLVISPISATGLVDIINSSSGTTHMIVDATGYFSAN